MIAFWLPVICALIHHGNALSEFEPFEEPCPPDSVQIQHTCQCDHSLCEKPPCQSTLVQITNLTDVPGSCCPTYSCEDCSEEDEIEGMCPCLPGAIIRSGRKCECANHHYTLVNNTCECDVNKCELPELCDERSVAVRDPDGDDCCEKIKCIQCPEDSYPTSYNNASVEDMCVCYQCRPFQCNGTQLHIIMKGKNIPGKCCDIYSCETRCSVNGTLYSDGESWISGDSQCNCQKGVSVCSITPREVSKACLDHDTIYKHLDTWVQDDCTNCTCFNGTPKCITHMCDIHTSEVKPPQFGECPSLATCKKECEYGFRVNRQGCKICKCKADKTAIQTKMNKLEIVLQEYNLTEEELMNLIRNRALYENTRDSSTSTTTSSTRTPATTICVTEHKNTRGDCTYSCILEYGIPGFVVGAIFSGILLFTFLKCSEKNRQKYKMHYNYKPVGKEALDKNLNISPIIKSKNFELKSYNEKKNVI